MNDLGKIEIEDIKTLNEYKKKIRNSKNEKIAEVYLWTIVDLVRERESFDKCSLIRFIEMLNETKVIDDRAFNILSQFIKPM
jgi:hypothetical protein